MAKDAEHRFPSGAALREALTTLGAQRDAAARRTWRVRLLRRSA